MKIVAFSDIHGQISKKLTQWFHNNPADILIFAGDLQAHHLDDGTGFIDWVSGLPYTYKIIGFGNHDGNHMYTKEYAKDFENIFILNNEEIIIDGIKIFASPYSVEYGKWWFMKPDSELEVVWKLIPDDVNILVTHTPAYGILDKTIDDRSVGSVSLLNKIKTLKELKYHVGAHIHESHGMKKFKHITHYNASILDERYRQVNKPYIFEY